MNAYKDRIAESERVKERKRSLSGKRSEDVPMETRNEEQMADRHAVASDEDEGQHDENGKREIHIGERGSETANEEQPDKFKKTVRSEQEAPNTSSSTMRVSPENPASERQDRTEPTYRFLRWMSSTRWVDEESPHQRNVGLVSRRRCRRSQEK